MDSGIKHGFFDTLTNRYGGLSRLEHSQSLFELAQGNVRVYVRYSKKHPGNRTFFGLRQIDLNQLEGHPAILCFLWDGQKEPLLIPFAEFEEVFNSVEPASDGQFKVQVYEEQEGAELYVVNAARFNVESYFGWDTFDRLLSEPSLALPEFSHSQVQSLLGAIGASKGFDIWVPCNDRGKTDSAIAHSMSFANAFPACLAPIRGIAEEVDVMWIERGAASPRAFFEVEHSTPIYSGLLRFNDIHILLPRLDAKFGIVCNEDRRASFVRRISRPTFRTSGLGEYCMFSEYRNVYGWHHRFSIRSSSSEPI